MDYVVMMLFIIEIIVWFILIQGISCQVKFKNLHFFNL